MSFKKPLSIETNLKKEEDDVIKEITTPPSINDPERMKILGEFTPIPNCYL